MIKRRLGRSEIEISALGLGCMEIGGRMKDDEGYYLSEAAKAKQPMFSLGDIDDEQSLRCLYYALDHGVNFFDTAPAYGAGHSETLLGRAFAGRRDQVVIATKFGKFISEEENRFGQYTNERELIGNIRKECEDSLRRLRTDTIDLYQFHQPRFPLEMAEEIVEILEALVSEGKIRFYAWSTNDPECARIFVQGEHCTAIQHNLNVIEDTPELLALCETFDQASIARGILGMGFLTGKYTPENYRSLIRSGDFRLRAETHFVDLLHKLDPIRDILTSNGRTIAQGALAWIWARSERTIPIPGFRTFEQVKENIDAVNYGPLTEDQMDQIDSVLVREPTHQD